MYDIKYHYTIQWSLFSINGLTCYSIIKLCCRFTLKYMNLDLYSILNIPSDLFIYHDNGAEHTLIRLIGADGALLNDAMDIFVGFRVAFPPNKYP